MANPFVQHPAFDEPMPVPAQGPVPVNPLTGPTPMGLELAQPSPAAPPAPPEQRSDNPPAPTPESIAASKYGDDLAATRRGYDEMFREVQQNLMPQIQAIKEQNQLLMERFLAAPAVPTTPERDSDMEALQTLGIPVDSLTRVVEKLADRRADALVKSRLEPIARFARAQTEIATEIPGYSEVAPKVQAFLSGRPTLEREVNEIAQLNPVAAMKYAYREYQAATPRVSAADSGLNRVNAAIPTSNSMGARMSAERDFQAELQAAKTYFEQSGDERPYWRIWNEMSGGVSHPAFSQTPG